MRPIPRTREFIQREFDGIRRFLLELEEVPLNTDPWWIHRMRVYDVHRLMLLKRSLELYDRRVN